MHCQIDPGLNQRYTGAGLGSWSTISLCGRAPGNGGQAFFGLPHPLKTAVPAPEHGRHPDVVGRRYASARCCAYQFLPAHLACAQSRLACRVLDPASQDQPALRFVWSGAALAAIDRWRLCDRTLDKLREKMASFPMVATEPAPTAAAKKPPQLCAFSYRAMPGTPGAVMPASGGL